MRKSKADIRLECGVRSFVNQIYDLSEKQDKERRRYPSTAQTEIFREGTPLMVAYPEKKDDIFLNLIGYESGRPFHSYSLLATLMATLEGADDDLVKKVMASLDAMIKNIKDWTASEK